MTMRFFTSIDPMRMGENNVAAVVFVFTDVTVGPAAVICP